MMTPARARAIAEYVALDSVEQEVRSALLDYAEIVERCKERIAKYERDVEDVGQSCVEMGREERANKKMCSELNYILEGDCDGK